MVNRRQPSGAFLRRVKSYSEPAKKPVSRIRRYKDSDAWLWTEVAAVVVGLAFVIPTAIALWIDLEDRQTQRIAQAWQLVTQVSPGNSGKGPALEYLNSQGIELVGIDLSADENQAGSFLVGVNLSGANLRSADLSEAMLIEADLSEAWFSGGNLSGADFGGANLSGAELLNTNLSGADLRSADLSRADLWEANLSGADLFGANLSRAMLIEGNLSGADLINANLSGATFDFVDLSGANLTGADLSGVYLIDADLSGADLSEVTNLTQSQLETACGNEETALPEGLIIKPCPVE